MKTLTLVLSLSVASLGAFLLFSRIPASSCSEITTRSRTRRANPASQGSNSTFLSWDDKVHHIAALGLPLQLPEPFHNIDWGSTTISHPDSLALRLNLTSTISGLLKQRHMRMVKSMGAIDGWFSIKPGDVKLLIAIGIQRILHQDFQCSHSRCRPVLVAAFKKVVKSYADYQKTALAWVTPKLSGSPSHVSVLWTSIFPTLTCSDSPRDCLDADGCRFFCNPKTLHHKGANGGKGKGLNIVGLGCNNEFAYEESFLKTYGSGVVNNMAIFDCTVPPEKLTPPAIVKDLPEFRYINKCLVSHGSQGPRKGLPPFTAKDLVAESGGRTHIDLFKVDIEGSEFGVFHELLIEQLKYDLLGIGTPPTISIIQFEMHLIILKDLKTDGPKVVQSLTQAGHFGHLILLELQALGFMPSRMEGNPWYPGLVEVMLPSSTYFIDSEVNEVFLPD